VTAASCPRCGSAGLPGARYCETCGADLNEPVTPAEWEALVRSDRAYFDRVEADGVDFPVSEVERIVSLAGERMTIGRSTASGPESPEVDMSGPPADVGVSRLHAVLEHQPDGTWTITDCGSSNGTYLNRGEDAIRPGEPVVLEDGDLVHIGAWTTITFRRVRVP
jgi:FHA domain